MDNYSAVQFIEDCQRACTSRIGCTDCPLFDYDMNNCSLFENLNAPEHLDSVKEKIELVHQWAKDNPIEPVKEESKQMTKADLKTGWIAESRHGEKYAILRNIVQFFKNDNVTDILCNANDGWLGLDSYNDDLTFKEDDENFDIVKVYQPTHPFATQDLEYDFENWTLLWERPEPKEEKQVKTYKDDFFEKFPNAPEEDNGTPRVCAKFIYGEGINCNDCRSVKCKETWNRPMGG